MVCRDECPEGEAQQPKAPEPEGPREQVDVAGKYPE